VRWSTRGTVTIRNAQREWPEVEGFASEIAEPMFSGRIRTANVSLVQKTRTQTRVMHWIEPAGGARLDGILIPASEYPPNRSGFFALPIDVSPNATALVSVNAPSQSPQVHLVWATGSTALVPTGREGLRIFTRAYAVPPEVLREIVATGGIVQVTIAPDENARVSIEIREKKP
jgi:hypothetical protein